jgi:hypothetical protein
MLRRPSATETSAWLIHVLFCPFIAASHLRAYNLVWGAAFLLFLWETLVNFQIKHAQQACLEQLLAKPSIVNQEIQDDAD